MRVRHFDALNVTGISKSNDLNNIREGQIMSKRPHMDISETAQYVDG